MSVSGRVAWPPEAPVWTFLWELVDGDTEAIAFRDIYFRGKKVLHKASLPMIRVHYNSGNGPYKDQLSIGNMQGPVKVYEHNQSGYRHLVVESYHKIGRYHLINRWFFRSDGLILPQLHSAGLQHPSTHQHHVYWRFDFDINGAGNDVFLRHFPNEATNWGYGPGWKPSGWENVIVDYVGSGRASAILDKSANLAYVIQRGPNDEEADAFSWYDGAAVVYHGSEDLRGKLGSASDDGLYQQVSGEPIDGADVVFWYIAHLHHHYPGPDGEWHVCGPLLWPVRY